MADAPVAAVSITQNLRDYLMQPTTRRTYSAARDSDPDNATLESVYSLAVKEGLTLQDYVWRDPEKALTTAQLVLSNWEAIQVSAALTGEVNGRRLTREAVKLINGAVERARDDFEKVNLIMAAGSPEDLNKDRVMMALLNKALKGDVKAIQYMIDRVEGRIPEAKAENLDYNSIGLVYSILNTLFDKQLEVLNSGPGERILCCSRRSGKSHLCAALALIEALRTTNIKVMIIGETAKQETSIIDQAMNDIIDRCKLKDSKGNRLSWHHLENGSEIMVRGLSNTKDPDQIRGHKCKLIVIDEFFHLKTDLLEYMKQDVLEPMQMDYADDYRLIMVGTPPKIKGTFGEKVWHESKIPHFSWTYQQNPHIKGGDAYVEAKLKEKGLDWNTPYARREYKCEWAYDDQALLYPVYHTWDEDHVPKFMIDKVVCGIDYGRHDNDAIVGIAWDTKARRGFTFYESKFNRLTTPQGMTQWEYLKSEAIQLWEYALEFWPHLEKKEANRLILWSADCSDGHLTEEFQFNVKCRYPDITMNIGTAHQHDAILMQDKIRDLFRTGMLLVQKNGRVAQECDMTILKRDLKGNLTIQIDNKAYHPDLLPALRYALWDVIGQEILSKGRSIQDDDSQMGRSRIDNDYPGDFVSDLV